MYDESVSFYQYGSKTERELCVIRQANKRQSAKLQTLVRRTVCVSYAHDVYFRRLNSLSFAGPDDHTICRSCRVAHYLNHVCIFPELNVHIMHY